MKARKQSLRQMVDAALNRDTVPPDPELAAIRKSLAALRPPTEKSVYFRGALVRRPPR